MHILLGILGVLLGAAAASIVARRRQVRDESRSRRRRQEEQNALMGTIASGLAHEIRNPLSTLRMNLQLLREDWNNPITEREQKGVRRIDGLLRETERLEHILSDFLRFASGHALRLEPTSLNGLAGELLDFIGPQAERAKIRVHRQLDPGLPPVRVDANLIRQAILNLLINAQQVMPNGGEITFRTAHENGLAKLSVADTGPGILPEHHNKIFNLYFSTRPGGTGLGLSMVKRIVEEHHGTVGFESSAGQGTTFTICLKTSAS